MLEAEGNVIHPGRGPAASPAAAAAPAAATGPSNGNATTAAINALIAQRIGGAPCPNAKEYSQSLCGGYWGSATVDFTNCAMLALVMAAAVLVSDGGQRFCEMEPAQRAALLASAQVILAFGGRPPSRHRYHDWPCVVGDTGRYANRMRKRLWR